MTPRDQMRNRLLELSDVTVGRRFGGEAFFFRKKFFCHFHPASENFFLETFVWNKLDEVVKQVPGVIPHPEYARHGWTRLSIASEGDVAAALRLVEVTYRILRTTKRVAIRKEKFSQESVEYAQNKFNQLEFSVKEAEKTVQVMIQAPTVAHYNEADALLEKVVKMLKE